MPKITIDEENGYVNINDVEYDMYEAGISESGKFIVSLPWLEDLKANLNIYKQKDVLKTNLGSRVEVLKATIKTMYSKDEVDRLKRKIKTLETKNESAKKVVNIVNNSNKILNRSIDLLDKQSKFLNELYNLVKAEGMMPEKVFKSGEVFRISTEDIAYTATAADPRYNYLFRVNLAGHEVSGLSVDISCNDKYQLLVPEKAPTIPNEIVQYILSEYKKSFVYDFDKQTVMDKYVSTLKEIKEFFNKSQEIIKDAQETSG